jgi:hypothetical protein
MATPAMHSETHQHVHVVIPAVDHISLLCRIEITEVCPIPVAEAGFVQSGSHGRHRSIRGDIPIVSHLGQTECDQEPRPAHGRSQSNCQDLWIEKGRVTSGSVEAEDVAEWVAELTDAATRRDV